jgi:hypothetical protein
MPIIPDMDKALKSELSEAASRPKGVKGTGDRGSEKLKVKRDK